MYKIKNLKELDNFVEEFLEKFTQGKEAKIIALSGDLGAGKTALVKSAAKYFELKEEITSPTFVIQKEYDILNDKRFKKMIHIDAYRLEDKSELEYLGWDEIIKNPEHIIFIEWPEQVEGIAMGDVLHITMRILDDEVREIEIFYAKNKN